MTPDDKLIEGCRDGKRRSQSELYHRFSPIMYGVCLRYARVREDAEDLLQEGFIKVFNSIGNFRGEGSFEGWIRRIMVNNCINYYRTSLKQQFVMVENIAEVTDRRDQEMPEEEELNLAALGSKPEVVMKMIQELPDGYRMVLNLYVFENYNHREIAEILGISENTSKSQLSKARKFLRRLLDDYLKKDEIKVLQYEK